MELDEDQAATKLQAIHKGRLQRKEVQERKAAAKRVHAAKMEQKAELKKKEQEEAAVKMQVSERARDRREEADGPSLSLIHI